MLSIIKSSTSSLLMRTRLGSTNIVTPFGSPHWFLKLFIRISRIHAPDGCASINQKISSALLSSTLECLPQFLFLLDDEIIRFLNDIHLVPLSHCLSPSHCSRYLYFQFSLSQLSAFNSQLAVRSSQFAARSSPIILYSRYPNLTASIPDESPEFVRCLSGWKW